MGCGMSHRLMIKDRMGEFEIRNPTKEIELNQKVQVINQPHYKVGDYFTVDIENQQFKYFESRFTTLIQKEIESKNVKINWDSPEMFVTSLMRNRQVRKSIIGIITRKGFDHPYRWLCWRLFAQAEDPLFGHNRDREARRRELYPKLIACHNENVESIVNKDVLRTARHKELFASLDAVGSQLLYDNCKAVGCFFPKTGYVQGMNFIMGFLLEISGLEEFATFNFVINFWKKRKNLYFGLFENGLPLVKFLVFAFHKLLEQRSKKVSETIRKQQIPDELWITKWLLSFYSFSVTKDYLIRIFDYLMVVDMFGLVYIGLVITEQLEKVILKSDLAEFAQVVGSPEALCGRLDYRRFVKALKTAEVSREQRVALLDSYFKSLDEGERGRFHYYYRVTRDRLTVTFKENWDEWETVEDYEDCDLPDIAQLYGA